MSTESPTGLSTSSAIVLAGCIIALGIYFGLRGREAPTPPVNQPLPAVPARGPTVLAAKPIVDQARVFREASAALDRHKKTLTEKCLAPALAQKPEPPRVKYSFNLTFDASGMVIARGIIEDHATARPDVATCVGDNFPELKVTPPGQTVRVDVPLELP